jgi:hypothetical protein
MVFFKDFLLTVACPSLIDNHACLPQLPQYRQGATDEGAEQQVCSAF